MGMAGADRWLPHVGTRVVVRVRTPSGGFRDVLGELLAARDGRLRVLTRRGEESVDAADVVAGKPVPPAPVRAAPPHRALSALALETVMARHWQAPETHRLGGWLLRASEGFTGRGNSVLPLGDPDRPLPDAVEAVTAWYRDRGLEPRAALPVPAPGSDEPDAGPLLAAAEAFAAAGWTVIPGAGADVLTAPTAELRVPRPLPPGLTLELLDEPDAAWLDAYHYRGQPLAPVARRLMLSAPAQVFAAVRSGGATVAIARGSFGAGWAGLTAVEVDPAFRRRGLAGALLTAVASWAWDRGAMSTFLQVGEINGPALRLYLDSGFDRHHTYSYLRPPT